MSLGLAHVLTWMGLFTDLHFIIRAHLEVWKSGIPLHLCSPFLLEMKMNRFSSDINDSSKG